MIQKNTQSTSKFDVRAITNLPSSVDAVVNGLKRHDWLLIDQKVVEEITGQTDPDQQALTLASATVPAPKIEMEIEFDFDSAEVRHQNTKKDSVGKQTNWWQQAATILVVCVETIVIFSNGDFESLNRRGLVEDDIPVEVIAAIESNWPTADVSPDLPTGQAAGVQVEQEVQPAHNPSPGFAPEA